VVAFIVVMVFFLAPIPFVVVWGGFRRGIPKTTGSLAGSKLILALMLAIWYGFLPYFIAPYALLNPFNKLDPSKDFTLFFTLLLIMASLFIALASQQMTYVNRLDDILQKLKKKEGKIKPEPLAAYFLVSCGFWAFSFAVPTTFGLIYVHFVSADSFTYGIYELGLAYLLMAGWIFLIASALRRIKSTRTEDGLTRKKASMSG